MLNMKKTGQKISSLRKKNQFTQEGLAEKLNITAQAISRWENGHSLPETAMLPYLAQVLGCSLDELLMPAFSNDETSGMKKEIIGFVNRSKNIIINAIDSDNFPISSAVTKIGNENLDFIYFRKSLGSEFSKWYLKNPNTTIYLFDDESVNPHRKNGNRCSLSLKGKIEIVDKHGVNEQILPHIKDVVNGDFALWRFSIQSGKYYKDVKDGSIRFTF